MVDRFEILQCFQGWRNLNRRYGASNVTFIVRVEFDRVGLKQNRIRRHFKRFFLPGALFVDRATREQHIYWANLTLAKTRYLELLHEQKSILTG